MARKTIVALGATYGRLTVIGASSRKGADGSYYWRCTCECGASVEVDRQSLRNGSTRSCGCLQREIAAVTCKGRTVHGAAKRDKHSATYKAWRYMRDRVRNDPDYAHALICDRWESFPNFLSDMGEQPEGKTLDRINNYKGYEPSNCRWVTRVEQANNKTSNRIIEYAGERMTLAEWSRKLNIHYGTLHSRLDLYFWPVEHAFTTPVRKHK